MVSKSPVCQATICVVWPNCSVKPAVIQVIITCHVVERAAWLVAYVLAFMFVLASKLLCHEASSPRP